MGRKPLISECEFLAEIEAAAADLELTPATLSHYAVENARLPERLRDGGTVTLKTIRRVREFIATRRRVP